MNFLCDVHIPKKLSKRLNELGFLSQHVNDILDKWYTKKDQDFRNSFLLSHKPRKLLKVNLGNISNEELLHTIESHIKWIEDINDGSSSFMIEIFKNDVWVVTK